MIQVKNVRQVRVSFPPKAAHAGGTSIAVHARDDEDAYTIHDSGGGCVRIKNEDVLDLVDALERAVGIVAGWTE